MNFMRKTMALALMLIALVFFSAVPASYATDRSVLSTDTGTLGADQYSITSDGSIVPNRGQAKYAYVTLSASGNAASPVVGGIGNAMPSVGLAGSPETAAAPGAVLMAEDADVLRFRFQLPPTFVDGGNASDLDINFYIEEEDDSSNISFDVSIYEWPCTTSTAILTDTVTVTNGAAITWYGLDTLSSGIGADSDIDADDILTIEISPVNAECDFAIYGMRLKYLTGIEKTQ